MTLQSKQLRLFRTLGATEQQQGCHRASTHCACQAGVDIGAAEKYAGGKAYEQLRDGEVNVWGQRYNAWQPGGD